jgi:hypothetical protein
VEQFVLFPPLVNNSAQEASLTMNSQSIAARNDGSLQIEVADTTFGGRILWNRQYYVVPLEVRPHSHRMNANNSQAKRFFCEKKGKEGEITNIRNKVFSGQILAEMLAGICHEEFYKYSDQEVPFPPLFPMCV